jgi:hypothetical protein
MEWLDLVGERLGKPYIMYTAILPRKPRVNGSQASISAAIGF